MPEKKILPHVDNTEESYSALSICTGFLRGLDRGVERITGPLRTIAIVEIEAFVIENLVAGMEAGLVAPAPVWANLKTFPWYYLRHKVFFLLGGYPCQPFSSAGLRLGAEDPRHLWPYIEFGIDAIRPVCCFFENVAGHLTLGFQQVAESLRRMGYAVEAGIYTAEEVGAPHRRSRLFILAILADAKGSVRGLYERSRRYRKAARDASGAGETVGDAYGAERGAIDTGRNGPDANGLHGDGSENTDLFEQSGQAMGHAEGNDERRERIGRTGGEGITAGGSGRTKLVHAPGDPEREPADRADALAAGGETRQESGLGRGAHLADTDGQQFDGSGIGRPGRGIEPADGGRSMGDAADEGLEGYAGYVAGAGEWKGPERPTTPAGLWPARPGEPQYEWEESRTVESGVGYTINGYNFIEDLLRGAGNGVVEQCAEIALIDLLAKHFE